MRRLLGEIDRTFHNGMFSVALINVLLLPDICGAVEYPDAARPRNSTRYIRWYDVNVGPHRGGPKFDGEVVWKLRNGMIHETSLQLGAFGFDRVLFRLPGHPAYIDMMITGGNGGVEATVLTIDLQRFSRDVVQAADRWLSDVEADEDPTRRERMEGLMQFRMNGLPPHIEGLPLIA
jgi:hypothetical protein